MSRPAHLALDMMGGDHGLRATFPAALASLRQHPDLQLTLVGDTAALRQRVVAAGPSAQRAIDAGRLRLVAAEQTVEMAEKPSAALRHKRRSSMRLTLDQLAAHEVDGVVSAGNTGALMAMSRAAVARLPGIDRPAFCTRLPTRRGPCYLLDLGANVDSHATHLLQFGVMGSALAAASDGIVAPSVALLNIGVEANKGNEQVRQADRLFRTATGLRYLGFVEADSLFDGDVDVVVADGFAGNVALKSCEGTAALIRDRIRARVNRGLSGRLLGLLAAPMLAQLYRELDPQRYSGAILLGLSGVVVKSHGNSGEQGFARAISYALAATQQQLCAAIEQRLAELTPNPS